MAETEVEIILREIRERVLSEQRARPAAASRRTAPAGGNGADDEAGSLQLTHRADGEVLAEEHLALINSYLTTTARAWDKLPPLVSNRGGLGAKIELWLKRNLKRATRWYVWEQVNFNAAVHHALRDLLPLLSAHEQELRIVRAQTDVDDDRKLIDDEKRQVELQQFQIEIEQLRLALETQRLQSDFRLAGLTAELRERVEHVLGEQRVSFKQVALETSEAAVLEDRARRRTEALLEELERRVEQLEK
jgi:hypothetical protein